MSDDKQEKRASFALRIAFRVFINVGVVWFLVAYFSSFFLLEGGWQTIAIAAITLTFLNALVVPVLNVLALPIKFVAWIVAFLIVNGIALWLTIRFIEILNIPGVSLAVGGGVVGWVVVSFVLGFGNWIVRAAVK